MTNVLVSIDWDCLVRFNGKTLALPKHENIKLNSMIQTREKSNTYFWAELAFEWREGAMVFRVFIFTFFSLRVCVCLKPTVQKSTCMRATAVTVMIPCTKMKFSIKDFFSKFDRIYSLLPIWSHLLKKSLLENFIFCAVIIFSKVMF